MPSVRAEVDDEEFEKLRRLKDEHGLTWRGMLMRAAEELESDE